MAMVYVTHNLGVVAAVCDRVGVMYAGELVEDAPVHELFSNPRHPYTRGLIDAVPSVAAPHRSRDFVLRGLLKRNELPKGCRFAPRCDFAEEACFEQRQVLRPIAPAHEAACRRLEEVEQLTAGRTSASSYVPLTAAADESLLDVAGLSITYDRRARRLGRAVRPQLVVVQDVTFDVCARETFSLVGESGSGKSTIARTVGGLLRPLSGQLTFEGHDLAATVEARSKDVRREIQIVLQNPGCVAQPAPARAPDRGPSARALLRAARQGATSRRREGARGRAPRRGLRQPLSGRALGRRAAADRDRPCARGTAAADALRRDPLGPRRVGADQHRRAAARVAGRAGDRLPLHLARPRGRPRALAPRRRALPGRAVRGRQGRGRLRPAVPPVHAHAALGGARDRRREHDFPRRPQRPRRRVRAARERLPVHRPLPVEDRPDLSRGRPAVADAPATGHMLRCHIPLEELSRRAALSAVRVGSLSNDRPAE